MLLRHIVQALAVVCTVSERLGAATNTSGSTGSGPWRAGQCRGKRTSCLRRRQRDGRCVALASVEQLEGRDFAGDDLLGSAPTRSKKDAPCRTGSCRRSVLVSAKHLQVDRASPQRSSCVWQKDERDDAAPTLYDMARREVTVRGAVSREEWTHRYWLKLWMKHQPGAAGTGELVQLRAY